MRFSGVLIGGWVAASTAFTLAACSGSSESGSENPTSPPAPAQTSTVGTECATGAELAEQLSDPRVSRVEVAGDCESVTVSTGLAEDHADLAVLVCAATAELAYASAALSRVSVTGESGDELAAGVRDQPCAAV